MHLTQRYLSHRMVARSAVGCRASQRRGSGHACDHPFTPANLHLPALLGINLTCQMSVMDGHTPSRAHEQQRPVAAQCDDRCRGSLHRASAPCMLPSATLAFTKPSHAPAQRPGSHLVRRVINPFPRALAIGARRTARGASSPDTCRRAGRCKSEIVRRTPRGLSDAAARHQHPLGCRWEKSDWAQGVDGIVSAQG